MVYGKVTASSGSTKSASKDIINTFTNASGATVNINMSNVKKYTQYKLATGRSGFEIYGSDGSTSCVTDDK